MEYNVIETWEKREVTTYIILKNKKKLSFKSRQKTLNLQ